jgi:hypothetical protein
MNACAAFAAVEARIITPILVHTFDPEMDATRAVIVPSPESARCAKWNASAVPHTSAPAPRTVYVPPLALADPAMPTAPMSLDCQPDGKLAVGDGALFAIDTLSKTAVASADVV